MSALEVPRGWNRHHVWYARADYRRGLRREFRNFAGNVVPVPVSQHNALHRELLPPPMPSRRQMLEGMDILSEHPESTEFTWGAIALQGYFLDEAFSLNSCEQAETALQISEHLRVQLGFLALQKVG